MFQTSTTVKELTKCDRRFVGDLNRPPQREDVCGRAVAGLAAHHVPHESPVLVPLLSPGEPSGRTVPNGDVYRSEGPGSAAGCARPLCGSGGHPEDVWSGFSATVRGRPSLHDPRVGRQRWPEPSVSTCPQVPPSRDGDGEQPRSTPTYPVAGVQVRGALTSLLPTRPTASEAVSSSTVHRTKASRGTLPSVDRRGYQRRDPADSRTVRGRWGFPCRAPSLPPDACLW
ncbi:hypothetical protein [Cyprinid herpesvirus 3]|uniref:ORF58R n=1 Tax=Cyprinid herpesvirus 3 TaxID=180230 RepID=A3QMM6_CYHV3|nr:hypothetical protein [Cyprinid herpesvirus 3]AIC32413.1 ORF58R [Cyprinid herpesvirus 3]QQZ02145.1 hypothetical protein KHV-MN_00066 [Cyprinid herpesvirus 3]BAF48870.1 hypothetical protein [Cyprinid herpesvirus 3]